MTLCKYPCCQRSVYKDANRIYDYCGRTHAQEHQRMQKQQQQGGKANSITASEDYIHNNGDRNTEEEEEARFEKELRLAIAESFKLEKRKREIAADEELARKLQLEEEEVGHHRTTTQRHPTNRSWICSLCTFENLKKDSMCDMCGTPTSIASTSSTRTTSSVPSLRPTPTNSSSPATSGEDYHLQLQELEEYWNAKEESLIVASKIWTCLTCHTTNRRDVLECSQCLEPKDASTNAVEETLWPCTQCTFDNSYADSICFMCGHKIPHNLRHLLNHNRPSECGMPGCCKSPSHYGFCSQSHFDLALEKNIIPPCERGVEAVLVGATGDYSIHLLRSKHPKHGSVKRQFVDSWKKTTDGYPRVERIYWIRMRPEILETFDLMKQQIGSNVQRLFHGTSQSSNCYFGTNPLKPPCNDKKCRVCSIIRTSFNLIHVKRGEGGKAWAHQTQQLRYGVSVLVFFSSFLCSFVCFHVFTYNIYYIYNYIF